MSHRSSGVHSTKKEKSTRNKKSSTEGSFRDLSRQKSSGGMDTDGPAPVRELSGLKLKRTGSGSRHKSSNNSGPGTQVFAGKDNTMTSSISSKDRSDKDRRPAFDKAVIQANGVSYTALQPIGNGSFGVVIQARETESGEIVAIKKVLQDKRFKNRELQIMQMLNHPNVCMLKNSFYVSGNKSDDVYLNLVLEFVPDTVYRVSRNYVKAKQNMPMPYIKVYTYQMLKALEYIHSEGICHRDIKPQNLLCDTESHVLKLCDFGSAKILVKGEPNVAYICSRYYRAPELIFGATDYSVAIDVWSTGCVLAELMLGQPMFPGDTGMDQLVEIIKVLGAPSREQILLMNPKHTNFKFPQIKPHPWSRVFKSRSDEAAIDLAAKLLVYEPTIRLNAVQGCAHHFFNDLRNPDWRLPNNQKPPTLEGIDFET